MNLRTLCTGGLLAGTTLAGLAVTAAPADAAGPDAQRERYDVAITVSDQEPELGDRITVKGFVGPAAPGRTVLLQVKYADQKQWKTVDSTRLTKASTYRFKAKLETVRQRSYRVVKPAVGSSGRAASQREKVTVFGWRDLTSLAPVGNGTFFEVPTVSLNGVAFPDSLLQSQVVDPTPRTVDYNLNRDCKALTTTAGLADVSPVASTATVAVGLDGVPAYSATFGLTQSAPVSLDLTGVFRLTASATSATGGQGALGSPQVLCSF